MKKRERTDNDEDEEEAEMNNGIKAEPPEDKENHQADDRVGELRDFNSLNWDYFRREIQTSLQGDHSG